MIAANEMQVGGAHYKSGYQHWDFVREALASRYMEGQITKYISRARKKNGVQDLQKALHFLAKLIEQETSPLWMSVSSESCAIRFCTENELNQSETLAIRTVTRWNGVEDLKFVIQVVNHMIDTQYAHDGSVK